MNTSGTPSYKAVCQCWGTERVSVHAIQIKGKDVASTCEKYQLSKYLVKFVRVMGGSPGDVSEEPVTQEKRKKGWRLSCDVREATEGLENEL